MASGPQPNACIGNYCQLDKDLLDVTLHGVLGLPQRAQVAMPSCDSSECLVCGYASECRLHASSAPGKLCSLLRKRSLSGSGALEANQIAPVPCSVAGRSTPAPTTHGSPARRQRLSERQDEQQSASTHANAVSDGAQAQVLGPQLPWTWQDTFDSKIDQPAPATLSEWNTWSLLPSQCGSHDMISALEFSPDGKLLISGSINKQLRLYSLAELYESAGILGGQLPTHSSSPSQLGSAAGASSELGFNSDDDEGTGRASSAHQGVRGWSNEPDSEQSGDELDYQPRRRWSRYTRRCSDVTAPPSSTGSGDGALVAVHRLPSKVSCVAWSHHLDGVVTVGDNDGVLTQLHVCSGHQLADVDAHAGRRIWGVAQSPLQPNLCASVADDGSACLWAGPCLEQCIAILKPHGHSRARLPGRSRHVSSSLCGVDFSSTHPHLLALASADQNVYVYDIRATHTPLHILSHHLRPVSYVKFFGSQQLVSASTDSTIAIWDLPSCAASPVGSNTLPSRLSEAPSSSLLSSNPASSDVCMQDVSTQGSPTAGQGHSSPEQGGSRGGSRGGSVPRGSSVVSDGSSSAGQLQPWKVLQGHKNERNFVGLAVRPEDGLIAIGSETSCVFTYHRAWRTPLATYDFCAPPVTRGASHWSARTAWARRLPLGNQVQGGSRGDASAAAFVSAVTWQSVAAAQELGMPPMLAAGTSWGDVRLLTLNQP